MLTLLLLVVAAVLFISIWLNKLSSNIGIPTLLAFLILGVLVSSSQIMPIQLNNFVFVQNICTVALIFIMFYGGFGTRWSTVKHIVTEAGLLASVGVFITAATTGAFQFYRCGLGLFYITLQKAWPKKQYCSNAGGRKRQ